MKKLTIVVPIYNVAGYLEKTLETLKQQTADFELWLIDDYSTDQSPKIATNFAKGIPNFHFERFSTHKGISAARNFGIKHANNDIISFVDSDDILQPIFSQTLIESFNADIVAASVGYTWRRSRISIDHPVVLNQRSMFEQVSSHGSEIGGYVWNKAFSIPAIKQIGLLFDESLPIAEDYLFTSTFVAKTPGQYAYNPQSLYTKITRPNSTIHTASFSDRQLEREVFKDISKLSHFIK